MIFPAAVPTFYGRINILYFYTPECDRIRLVSARTVQSFLLKVYGKFDL